MSSAGGGAPPRAGTLAGEKVARVWRIYLPADADRQDATGSAPVDLAPLVGELHALRVELQRVTEASTVWQLRAEQQLKQLTAGTVEPASMDVPAETTPAEHARTALEPQSAPNVPPALWRRVRRGLGGT